MLGLAILQLVVGGDLDIDLDRDRDREAARAGFVRVGHGDAAPLPADAGFHRGTGWYGAGSVPEPPYALGLVIVAAAGMRRYERRRSCRAAIA